MLILHIRLYCKQCSTRNCMDHSSWWFCIATHPKTEKVDDNTACSYYFHKNNDGGDNRQNQDAVLELFWNLKKDRVFNHSSLQEALINSEFILCSYGYKLSLCLPTLVF